MDNPWELYSTDPYFAHATQALDRAWEEAKLLAPELPSVDRAYRAELHVYEVMKDWAKVGAMDTEPLAELRQRVRKHFGCDGGWL